MTNLTAMSIASNYPENILISWGKSTKNGRYYGAIYLLRDGEIHTSLVSHDIGSPGYDTPEEAEQFLKKTCEVCVNYFKKKLMRKSKNKQWIDKK